MKKWEVAILQSKGLARLLNTMSEEESRAFSESPVLRELQSALGRFKEKPTRVVTVRMTESLHEELKEKAHQERTSLNNFCVSKLLESIDQDLAPGSTSLEHPADRSDI